MVATSVRVPLRHVSAVPRHVRLRELQGRDELGVAGIDTRSAVDLLDGLLDGPSDEPPPSAAQLSASDRDALLAALHRTLWGDRIVSSLRCRACAAWFDLSFELSALQRQLISQTGPLRVLDVPRCIEDAAGARFRLPGAADEERAAHLGIGAGIAALHASITGSDDTDFQALGERLEALAPLIDVDLEAHCAECGHADAVRFDLQSFVLQRLLDEREGVLGEVHALASGYGWSLNEIVSLPRSLRRSLVQRLVATPAFG